MLLLNHLKFHTWLALYFYYTKLLQWVYIMIRINSTPLQCQQGPPWPLPTSLIPFLITLPLFFSHWHFASPRHKPNLCLWALLCTNCAFFLGTSALYHDSLPSFWYRLNARLLKETPLTAILHPTSIAFCHSTPFSSPQSYYQYLQFLSVWTRGSTDCLLFPHTSIPTHQGQESCQFYSLPCTQHFKQCLVLN